MNTEGNLEPAGLSGETKTPNARSRAIARTSSAAAKEEQDDDGATESIMRPWRGGLNADVVPANNTKWVCNQEATLHPMNVAVAIRQWNIWSFILNTPSCP